MHFRIVSSFTIAALAAAATKLQFLEHRYATADPHGWHTVDSDESYNDVSIETDHDATLHPRGLSESVDISNRLQNKELMNGPLNLPPIPIGNVIVSGQTTVKLTCIDCWTNGTIGVGFDIKESEDKLAAVTDLITSDDPLSDLIAIFNPVLRVDLSNIEIYAHIKLQVASGLTVQLVLWGLRYHSGHRHKPTIPSWSFDFAVYCVTCGLRASTRERRLYNLASGCLHRSRCGDWRYCESDIVSQYTLKRINEPDELTINSQGTQVKAIPVKVTVGDIYVYADLRVTLGLDLGIGPSLIISNKGGKKGDMQPAFSSFSKATLPAAPGGSAKRSVEREISPADSTLDRRFTVGLSPSIGAAIWLNVVEWGCYRYP